MAGALGSLFLGGQTLLMAVRFQEAPIALSNFLRLLVAQDASSPASSPLHLLHLGSDLDPCSLFQPLHPTAFHAKKQGETKGKRPRAEPCTFRSLRRRKKTRTRGANTLLQGLFEMGSILSFKWSRMALADSILFQEHPKVS